MPATILSLQVSESHAYRRVAEYATDDVAARTMSYPQDTERGGGKDRLWLLSLHRLCICRDKRRQGALCEPFTRGSKRLPGAHCWHDTQDDGSGRLFHDKMGVACQSQQSGSTKLCESRPSGYQLLSVTALG